MLEGPRRQGSGNSLAQGPGTRTEESGVYYQGSVAEKAEALLKCKVSSPGCLCHRAVVRNTIDFVASTQIFISHDFGG